MRGYQDDPITRFKKEAPQVRIFHQLFFNKLCSGVQIGLIE